jgi:hypothetical protein
VDGTATIDFQAGQRLTGTLRASGAALGGRTLELDVSGRFYPERDVPWTLPWTAGERRVRLLVDVY